MPGSNEIFGSAKTVAPHLRSPPGFPLDLLNQSVVACFEHQAQQYADRLALRTETASLAYRELNRKANGIAYSLLALGGDSEEPVALFLDDSVETIAAMLGVLKAGGIYLPLDPHVPLSRAAYIVKDAGAAAVVTNRELVSRARELAGPNVALVLTDESSRTTDDNPGLAIGPDQLASLYYTSGSTGAPKGVPSSHRARLVNFTLYANALRLTPADRLILLYSCTFSGSVNNLFGALLTGASLFPFDVGKQGIPSLASWIDQHQISIYHSVPAIFRGLAESAQRSQLHHLRVVVLASDTAHEGDVDAFRAVCPSSCRLANSWGVSESPFFRPYWVDESREVLGGGLPAVGPPAVGAEEVLLLDEQGREAPEDETGEIVLRSRDLTPGYWRKPEITRLRFFSDPDDDTLRRYHTGDLGRRLSDGSILHLGRKDFQIKIRGYRIEVEEIEAVLRDMPEVKSAAVVAEDCGQGERRLVAHVAGRPDHQFETQALRHRLRRKLPDYMTPELFVRHDALPLTPGGKIDRQALSSDKTRRETSGARRAPRDSTEQQLVEIWRNALRLPVIGIDENFFDLGGNSLQALRIALRIEKIFGKPLLPSVLVERPTIEELAEFITAAAGGTEQILVPLQPHGAHPPLFLVHGSGGHVLFYRDLAKALGPEQPVYGLQACGLDGSRPPLTDVREMATRYVTEVRGVQPMGPYRLAGYCFGSYVALEMAAILSSLGEDVDFLASLNADGEWRCVSSWREGLRFHRSRLTRLTWGARSRYVADRLRYRWAFARNRVAAGFASLAPRRLARFRVETACDQASSDYVPSAFSGRIELFQAEEQLCNNPQLFWGPIATEGVEVHRVPGGNETMFRQPHVQVLARKLGRRLAAIQ